MADTLTVRWPKKFGQQTVIIDAAAFDPAIHQRVEAPDEPLAADAEPAMTAEPAHHAARHGPKAKGK